MLRDSEVMDSKANFVKKKRHFEVHVEFHGRG
jgi:hypothetical protein